MNRIIVFIIVISRRLTAERPAAVNYHLNRPGTLITGYLKRLIDINGVRIHGFGRLAVCGFNIHRPAPNKTRTFIRNVSDKSIVHADIPASVYRIDCRLRFELHTMLYNRISTIVEVKDIFRGN